MNNTNLVEYLLAGSELNNPVVKDIKSILSFYTNIFDQLYNEFFYFDASNHRFVLSKQNVVVPPIPHELRNFIEFDLDENHEIIGIKNKLGIKVMIPRLITHSPIIIETFNRYLENNNFYDIPILLDGKIEFDEFSQPHLISRVLEEHMITINDYPHLKEPLELYKKELDAYLKNKTEVSLINDLYDYLVDIHNNLGENKIYSCLGNYQNDTLNTYFFNQEMTINIENDVLYFEYVPYTITIDDSWLYLLSDQEKETIYPVLTSLKQAVNGLKHFDFDSYQQFNILNLADLEAIIVKPQPNNLQTKLDYLNYLENPCNHINVLEKKEYNPNKDQIKLINPLKDYVVISDLVEDHIANFKSTIFISDSPYQNFQPAYFDKKNREFTSKYQTVEQALDLKTSLDTQKELLKQELTILQHQHRGYITINNQDYTIDQAKELVEKIDLQNETVAVVLEATKHQQFLQLIKKINYEYYIKLNEPLISCNSMVKPEQFTQLIKQYQAIDDLTKSHQTILEGLNYSKKELYACFQLDIDVNYYLKELKDVKSIIENEVISDFIIETFKGKNKYKLSRVATSFNLLVKQLDYINEKYPSLFDHEIIFDLFEYKDIDFYLRDVEVLINKKYNTIPKKYYFLFENVFINQNDINSSKNLLILRDYLHFKLDLRIANNILKSIYDQLQLPNFTEASDYGSLITKTDYLYSLINFNRRYHNLMYELTIINSPLMNELVLPTSINIEKIIEFLQAYQARYDVVALELEIKKTISRFIKNNLHLDKTLNFNLIYQAMINFDYECYQKLYNELNILNDLIISQETLKDLFDEIKTIDLNQYQTYMSLYQANLLYQSMSNEDILIANQLKKFIEQSEDYDQEIENQYTQAIINQIVAIDQEINDIYMYAFINVCLEKDIYPFNAMTIAQFEANFDCLNNHFDCLILDGANSYEQNIIRIFPMFDQIILLENTKAIENNIYQAYHEIINEKEEVSLKYELLDESILVNDQQLYRVRYLITDEDYGIAPGSLGGYISGYHNMLQDDHAYVLDQAVIMDNALIKDYAIVKDNACLKGNSLVNQYALVKDNACINDQAIITGFATISDFACINNQAQVSGNAKVGGNALINDQVIIKDNAVINDQASLYQNAQVFENAQIKDSAVVSDNAQISGYSQVEGKVYQNVKISDNAFISSNQEYFDDKIITH